MAFSVGSRSPFAAPVMATGNSTVRQGQDLEEISTEGIGFQAIAGETKLQLLRTPWPSDALPPPTASLLSVASKKGLMAAGGPDSVIIASTDSVRQAYNTSTGGSVKSFEPQLTLNLGMRISQVAFAANEDFLVLSAENGGGLAVYEVQSLMQGKTQSAFELSTNGMAIRELSPNPVPDKAELIAVVTSNGQLMMANLQSRQFHSGAQGQVLKDGVSCIAWSNRGKQLIAGLANGALVQMTPEGEEKGEIPKPNWLEGDQHVSSIDWLENDIFLTAHTPSVADSGQPPLTTYHLVTRTKAADKAIVFQTFPELSPQFNPDRCPPFQFMRRLREFPPSLTDLIVVASTASVDVSLVTRSKLPLSSDLSPEQGVDVFTATMMADDSRRAQLPMTENMTDTSPVGVAFDLSSKDKVQRPLPKEEFEESPGPLPALMVLNNEGVLATWWLVYAESIRQGTNFPGLASVPSDPSIQQTQQLRQASPFAATATPSGPAFGQSGFGKPSISSAPFASASTQSGSPFGSTQGAGSAFGAASGLGQKSSPWGSNAAGNQGSLATSSQAAFGSSNNTGSPHQSSAFGVSGGLGNRASPWGTPSSGMATNVGSGFGQTGKLGSQASPFGSSGGVSAENKAATSSSSGFASFAKAQTGFSAVGSSSGNTQSIFGHAATSLPSSTGANAFGNFGKTEEPKESTGVFGRSGFRLDSTFKPDGPAETDSPRSTEDVTASLFGNNFGSALATGTGSQTKDADMDESEDNISQRADGPNKSENVPFKLTSPKLFSQTATFPKNGNLFGTTSPTNTGDDANHQLKPAGFQFGSVPSPGKEPSEEKTDEDLTTSAQKSPVIKEEPQDDGKIGSFDEDEAKSFHDSAESNEEKERSQRTPRQSAATPPPRSPELPVPPESTSKTAFAPGDSSNSSKSSDDAPLPPDFLPTKTKLQEVEAAAPEESHLPDESGEEQENEAEGEEGSAAEALDDEGSGVDVAQEISPSSSKESSKITPESSFGFSGSVPRPGNPFKSAQEDAKTNNFALFGEVDKAPVPLFPLPKAQESPRSPSPVRASSSLNELRPESSRSLSAPSPVNTPNTLFATSRPQPSRQQPQQSAKVFRAREQDRQMAERSQLFEEAYQPLSDEEDEEIHKILALDVEPSTTLDKFVAHQDYVGHVEKPGIPGQIEKVFRDINSMIDTLGINTRSLSAFTKAHGVKSDPARDQREDLEDLDDWHLIDVEDLDATEDDLFAQLEEDQLDDVATKLGSIRSMRAEIRGLRLQSHDLARSTESNVNAAALNGRNQRPLNLDQQTQLKDLRRTFKSFQKLLADAEESIMQLRNNIAVKGGSCTKDGKAASRQPTAEAVENTVRKMTKMILEKNSDIEHLSSQISSLQLGSPSTYSQLLSSSSKHYRQGSKSTAGVPEMGSSMKKKLVERSGQRSRFSTQHEDTPTDQIPLRNGNSTPTPDFADMEHIKEARRKVQRRREINEAVRQVFGSGDLKVRPLD